MTENPYGLLFDIDSFAVHDGPGIRLAVYLKGCLLACAWCHSPESRRPDRELIYLRERCTACGLCAAVCPKDVHVVQGGRHALRWDQCTACGACVEACPHQALAITGYRLPADEVVARAVRMKPFFAHSGGGITLTGGEVTWQPEFAAAVLAGCQAEGIHTALETSGACRWETLEALLAHTDLVLYDLKLIDDEAHRRWTRATNRQILANAERLAGRAVQIRIPLIPSITDTEANLRGLFAFMQGAGLRQAALLPYNPATAAKHEWLGQECEIAGEPQSPARLAEIIALAHEYDVDAVVT